MRIDFKKNITMFALVFFIMILPVVRSAGAATFCVSDAGGLQAALTQAASNGEDDTIRIVQGTYVGNFVYASFEANALTIEGATHRAAPPGPLTRRTRSWTAMEPETSL